MTDNDRNGPALAASIFVRDPESEAVDLTWESIEACHDSILAKLQLVQQRVSDALPLAEGSAMVRYLMPTQGRIDQAMRAATLAGPLLKAIFVSMNDLDEVVALGARCHALLYRARLCIFLGLGLPGSQLHNWGGYAADSADLARFLSTISSSAVDASLGACTLAQMLYNTWPEERDLPMPEEIPSSIIPGEEPIWRDFGISELAGEIALVKSSLLSAIAERGRLINRAENELKQLVEAGKTSGLTWKEIGGAAGVTASAALRKYDADARRRHSDYKRKPKDDGK